jgi:hypothetical protein
MALRGPTRTAVEAALLTAIVVAAAWFIFRATVYVTPPPPAPPPAPPPPDEAIVVAVVGDVVRLSPTGAVSALSVGQRLRAEDSLRTGRGGRTELQMGGRKRLSVAENTLLTFHELGAKVHRLSISRGHIAVDYPEDGVHTLRIESESGEVETQGARFSMLATGNAVAVATETGKVNLTAQKSTVAVAAGMQSIALSGKAPSAAEPIPARLLLKVANAAAPAEELCAEVQGVAPRGAEVSVDGAPVALGEDGSFHLRVPRAHDKTSALLSTRDASGRETTRTLYCKGASLESRIKDFAIRWRKRGQGP